MDLDPGTPQNLEIVLPSQADVLERTDVTTNMNGPEPSVEPTKPSREEVDWETLKRSEVSEQQDPLSNPVDVTFLRQRLESKFRDLLHKIELHYSRTKSSASSVIDSIEPGVYSFATFLATTDSTFSRRHSHM